MISTIIPLKRLIDHPCLKEINVHKDFKNEKKRKAFLKTPFPDLEKYNLQREKIRQEIDKQDHYMRSAYWEPILTKEQEQYLFKRYNCLKWMMVNVRPTRKLLREALEIKAHIVGANYRLAINRVARYYKMQECFQDLLSEALQAINRSAEKFDFNRGTKFSTYATWAIDNALLRTASMIKTQQQRYCGVNDEEIFELHPTCIIDEEPTFDFSNRVELVDDLLRVLEPRQRFVVASRFGLNCEFRTLDQVGELLDVSKERVRQLEVKALDKLRERVKAMQMADKDDISLNSALWSHSVVNFNEWFERSQIEPLGVKTEIEICGKSVSIATGISVTGSINNREFEDQYFHAVPNDRFISMLRETFRTIAPNERVSFQIVVTQDGNCRLYADGEKSLNTYKITDTLKFSSLPTSLFQ